MSIQVKINDDGDICLDSGHLEWIDDNNAVVQHIRSRLQFCKNTFAPYPDSGVPYFSYVLGSKNKNVAFSIIKKVIEETPNVDKILEFNYTFDSRTRTMTTYFKISTIFGTTSSDINFSL